MAAIRTDDTAHSTERRVALVIGNGAYSHTLPLANPSSDALAVKEVLARLGFDVRLGLDLRRDAMEDLLGDFEASIKGAHVALLFYAGHGLQVKGRNYLIPVDADIRQEVHLMRRAFPLDAIQEIMAHRAGISLIFLDAGRDNPFARSLLAGLPETEHKRYAARSGLAEVKVYGGSFIAFATAPNNVAYDGSDVHSPFTQALLTHIETPDQSVTDMMIMVRSQVLRDTKGRQEPWDQSALRERFCFKVSSSLAMKSDLFQTVPLGTNERAEKLWHDNNIGETENLHLISAYIAQVESYAPLWALKARKRHQAVEAATAQGLDSTQLAERFLMLPRMAASLIASRAAMRALPLLATGSAEKGWVRKLLDKTRPFPYWPEGERSRHLLSIFRCYEAGDLLRSATLKSPASHDAAASAAAAAHAAASAAAAVNDAAGADDALAVAYAAAHAATATADGPVNDAARAAAAVAARTSAAAFKADLHLVENSQTIDILINTPLWHDDGMPDKIIVMYDRFREDCRSLNAGFDHWLNWYDDRLAGRIAEIEIAKKRVLLSEERCTQDPTAINAYLAEITSRAARRPLNRVRAIFIGHGAAGKTTLIRALFGEDVKAKSIRRTPGINIEEDDERSIAGCRVDIAPRQLDGGNITVYYWDFGGQVMVHHTHQFFLRSRCLYVVVLDGRSEIEANDQARYWLEHVRAYGGDSPVIIVGNKIDEGPVDIDLASLRKIFPNILGFYELAAREYKTRKHQSQFKRFSTAFREGIADVDRRNPEYFNDKEFALMEVLRTAAGPDAAFLPMDKFRCICHEHGLDNEDRIAWARNLLDKLGVVLHFPEIPALNALLVNPEWLTFGVYTIMFSEAAAGAKGRLSTHDIFDILDNKKVEDRNGHPLKYPPDRCVFIIEAMEQFKVAFRPSHDRNKLIIPALLSKEQPPHNFSFYDAWSFRLRCEGFLPRHVLPSLMADRHWDIVAHELWQFGAHFKSNHDQAESFVQVDHHTRTLTIWVRGKDAQTYLGILREIVLRALKDMKHIKYFEEVELTPGMRVPDGDEPPESLLREPEPVWVDYRQIINVLRRPGMQLQAGDGFYDLSKIAGLPAPREIVFPLVDVDKTLQQMREAPHSAALDAIRAELDQLREALKTARTPEERNNVRERLFAFSEQLLHTTKIGEAAVKWSGWLTAIAKLLGM